MSVVEALVVGAGADPSKAEALASHLGIPVVAEGAAERESTVLHMADEGLALRGAGMELRPDLTRLVPRLRPDRLARELLVRAAKMRGLDRPVQAIDATAGLGEDALLLAAAGCEVRLFESDPVIAALLADALARAADDPRLSDAVSRMSLSEGDSITAMAALPESPDVVYLDPMFPERTKSAAVKKKFQLLHLLERPCADEEGLLAAALATGARKVVVKRPAKGPVLGDAKPSYSLAGKAVRYDCYVQIG